MLRTLVFICVCISFILSIVLPTALDPLTEDAIEFEARLEDEIMATFGSSRQDNSEEAESRRTHLEEYVRKVMLDGCRKDYIVSVIDYLKGNLEESFSGFEKLLEREAFNNSMHVISYSNALINHGYVRKAFQMLKRSLQENHATFPSIKLYDTIIDILSHLSPHVDDEGLNILARSVSIYPENNFRAWHMLSSEFASKVISGYFDEENTRTQWQMSRFKQYSTLFTIGVQLFPRMPTMLFSAASSLAYSDTIIGMACARHLYRKCIEISSIVGSFPHIAEQAKLRLLSIPDTYHTDDHSICEITSNTKNVVVSSYGNDALSIDDTIFDTTEHKLWLHVGCHDKERCPKLGWTIIDGNMTEFPVHISSNINDLSMISSRSVEKIYSSHVLEHLSPVFNKDTHQKGYSELCEALAEFNRVMELGGILYVSVPDIDTIIQVYNTPGLTRKDKNSVLVQIFGGQSNAYDFHKMGWTEEELVHRLRVFGYCEMERIQDFGIFIDDASTKVMNIRNDILPLSLNVLAKKCEDIEEMTSLETDKSRNLVVDEAVVASSGPEYEQEENHDLFTCVYP